MSLASIKIALESAVKSAFPTMPIGWENVSYSPPVDGSMWFAVNVIPATPENPTLGDAFHREVGFMQIMISSPIDGGSGKSYSKAELIRDAFPRGTSFTSGGYTVTIAKTASIGPGSRQQDRFMLPVRIYWFANIFD